MRTEYEMSKEQIFLVSTRKSPLIKFDLYSLSSVWEVSDEFYKQIQQFGQLSFDSRASLFDKGFIMSESKKSTVIDPPGIPLSPMSLEFTNGPFACPFAVRLS